MRNSENQPLNISYGIEQKDLPLVADCAVKIFTEITGAAMPEWTFHHSRIVNELNQGREGLDVKLQTGLGSMTLSVKENGSLLVFALDANKHEKPETLRNYYETMERQFEQEFSNRLCELGVAQAIINY